VGAGDAARLDRKPGESVDHATAVEVVERPLYVSRGGDKLAGALDAFRVDPRDRVCLDVGASTGGFTDVLLRRGARRVYALDVGRGQLAESLRADPRVVSMERTHARRLDPDDPDPLTLPERVSISVVDVSFISVTRILGGVAAWTDHGGEIVALVKPQFESQPRDVPHGVVREESVRQAAIARVAEHATLLGLTIRGRVESPLVGPSGNHEYFLHMGVA
jgi:23S rRNA (cytidine1920-2'-O)/16S rRNA (cytidine1409-2'-O)-methyltransferase